MCSPAKSPPMPLKRARQPSEDKWNEWCSECFHGGRLLCCDGCPRAYHYACSNQQSHPPGEWYCPGCRTEREGGITARYAHILEREKEHIQGAPTALSFFVCDVLPTFNSQTPSCDFKIPEASCNPPRTRDEHGRIELPGYARAFAYLGFKVDPNGTGEADIWRVEESFDYAAFRVALEHVLTGKPAAELLGSASRASSANVESPPLRVAIPREQPGSAVRSSTKKDTVNTVSRDAALHMCSSSLTASPSGPSPGSTPCGPAEGMRKSGVEYDPRWLQLVSQRDEQLPFHRSRCSSSPHTLHTTSVLLLLLRASPSDIP